MAIKLTELDEAVSFDGLVAYGVDTVRDLSVHIPLGFVKQGVDAARAAAAVAVENAAAAALAAQSADVATKNTNAAIATAGEVAANPTKIGEDNYVYVYDLETGVYDKTDIYVRGTDGYGAVLQDVGTSTTGVMSQKATTDALARKLELNGEGDLPVAATAAAIAHLRALNTAGESVNATPAQIQEMVGIDYSSLTEQPVPGEFFKDVNGSKKQVYGRFVEMTFPSNFTGVVSLGFSAFPIIDVIGFLYESTNSSTIHLASSFVYSKLVDIPLDYQVYVSIPRTAQYGWRLRVVVKYVKQYK